MRFKLKLLLKAALLLLIVMVITSCINDNGILKSKIKVSEEIVNLSIPVKGEIAGINASGNMKIEYVVGNDNKITISGAENVVKAMDVSFDDNNTLNLRLNNSGRYKFVSARQRIKVYVTSPSARYFMASATAKISIDSICSDTTFAFKANSVGKIFISKVKASSVDIESTSTGKIELEQLVSATLNAEATSTGKIDIEDANLTSVILAASSTGKINFDNVVATEIKATANSTAKINLHGKADRVVFNASSTARINASELKANSGSLSASSSAKITSDVAEASVSESSTGKVKNSVR